MPAANPLYVLIAVGSGLAGLAMGWPGLRNRDKPGATGYLIVVVSGSTYALATAVGAVVGNQWTLFALQNLTVLAGGGLGVGWILLAGEYTGKIAPTRRALGVAGAYLLAVQAVAWTNPLHGGFYVPIEAVVANFPANVRMLFWGNVGVTYALITIGTVLVLAEALGSDGVRRKQSLALAATPIPGIAANLVSNLRIVPVDLTPLAYPAALAVLAWALFRADFLDVVTVGRATVLERMTDPVVILDDEDRIVDCNAAARDLVDCEYGWEGTPVEEFFAPVPRLAAAIRDDGTAADDVVAEVDGNERVFDVTVSPVTNDDTAADHVRGRIAVFRDVTETARQRRRVERQNERLERLADVISHDMRGPVETSRKTVTLLRREMDEPDAVVDRSLTNLEAVTARLDEFVEHLPTLARESTEVSSATDCDLGPIARSAWRVVDTGDVDLTVETTRELRADPSRLQQALENLFRNAAEHGAQSANGDGDSAQAGSAAPDSEVRPVASEPDTTSPDPHADGGEGSDRLDAATVTDEGPDGVTTVRIGTLTDGFYVADDGPGIEPALREDVFEFGTTTGTGSGFGLAIVRSIVEAHGWSIEATAGADGGARFEVHTDR